jgi:hypothetical protein
MCDYVYIGNDVDSEQEVEKNPRMFLWARNESFNYLFELKKNYNFHVGNHIMNIGTLLICLLPLVQNFTICF